MAPLLLLLTNGWQKMAAYAIAITIVVAAFFGVLCKAKQEGKAEARQEQLEFAFEATQHAKDIDDSVRGSSDADVDRLLKRYYRNE